MNLIFLRKKNSSIGSPRPAGDDTTTASVTAVMFPRPIIWPSARHRHWRGLLSRIVRRKVRQTDVVDFRVFVRPDLRALVLADMKRGVAEPLFQAGITSAGKDEINAMRLKFELDASGHPMKVDAGAAFRECPHMFFGGALLILGRAPGKIIGLHEDGRVVARLRIFHPPLVDLFPNGLEAIGIFLLTIRADDREYPVLELADLLELDGGFRILI